MESIFLFLFTDVINLKFNCTRTTASTAQYLYVSLSTPPPPTWLLASPLLITPVSRAHVWSVLQIISFHCVASTYTPYGFVGVSEDFWPQKWAPAWALVSSWHFDWWEDSSCLNLKQGLGWLQGRPASEFLVTSAVVLGPWSLPAFVCDCRLSLCMC